MAVSLNWSMTAVGYRRHTRNAVAVVGLSHMSTHNVLRFAEDLQLYTGWLQTEGAQPQLEGMRAADRPTWVALTEMFAEQRVVKTEGIASGTLTFVAAVPAHGQPPAGALIAWADERSLPWVEVVDNEVAYWGGLADAQIDRLMTWFCCQRPLTCDWRTTTIDPRLAARLRHGLFEHGWTRNLELAKVGRKVTQDLWGGVHASCILEHVNLMPPSRIGQGLRITLAGTEFAATDIGDRCVLDDATGKLPVK
jgi:hypothetical protein